MKKKIIIKIKQVIIILTVIFNILPLGIFYWQPEPKDAKAVDLTIVSKTSQSDWAAGKYEFNEIDLNGSAGDIKLQADLGSWDASGPASINKYIYTNTKLIKVNRYLYLFRNRTLGQFLRYDLDSKEWKEMAYLPIEPYEVLDATTNGVDKIYAFATRTGRQHFLTYDIPTNTWTLGDAGNTLGAGATLEYVSGATDYIYAFRGNNSTDFWRYNFETWGSLTNSTARCTTYCDLMYDGTKYLYAMIDYSTDRLYRLDTTVAAPTWTAIGTSLPDGSSYYPSDMVTVNGNIYMLKGNGTKTFYRYNGTSWSEMANLPYVTTYGSITYDGDNGENRIIAYVDNGTLLYYYIDTNTWSQGSPGPTLYSYDGSQTFTSDNNGNYYVCRAQNSATCYKFDGSTWTTITFATGNLADNTVMAFLNGYLYVGMGNSTNFRQVTPATGASASLTSTSNNFSVGSSMAASESANLFVVHGNSTAFRRYNTSSGWTTLATFPETAGRGTSIARLGNHIYGVLGNNRGRTYRYSEIANSWEEMASLPVGVYSGGQMISDGARYLYIQTGGDNDLTAKQFYRYDSQNNLWERKADTPNIVRYGGGLGINTANGNIYSNQGYGGGFWKYSQPTKTYTTSGAWHSPVYDLSSVSSFESFTSTTAPAAGVENSILFYSRSSGDSIVWDEWEPITTNISSLPKRYLQIRIVLTGDSGGTVTPTVGDFSFEYYKDITNPDVTGLDLEAYSASGGAVLVSGSTYSHRNPYFQWQPATDVGSGLDGYNVYFGTESNPLTGWSFQRNTNYTVNSGMISGSTYNFIIKAKDKEGNLSDPVSFVYDYSGISPSVTKSITNQSDWDNNEASKSAVYTSSTDWWNQSYLYRKQLSITAVSDLNPGNLAVTTEDSSLLEAAGKVRADRKDWRIIYKDGTFWREIDRRYIDGTTTHFAIQKGINNGSTDNNYYIYYGNSDEDIDPLNNISASRVNTKYSQSLSFDGGDYIRLGTMNTVMNGLSSLTIEGWFKYINANGIRSLYGSNTTQQTAINIPNGQNYLQYQVRTITSSTVYSNTGTGFLLPNTWNHFALTYDESTGTARGFLNGRLDYERTGITGTILASATQYIGYNSTNGGYMYGFLDEYRISNSIRYTSDFTSSTAPFTSDDNTLGLYHLDDGTGQTATDSSSNGLNGGLGSGSGVDGNDPTWMTVSSLTSQEEGNAPASADTGLTLEPMTGGSWGGYQLPSLPWGLRLQYGAAAYANNNLYVLRGYNTTTFYKLDLTTNLWTQLKDTPAAVYYGSAMAYDGNDTIYTLRGNNTTDFYKYTISTNTWSSSLTQPSLLFTYGGALTKGKDYDGNDVLFAIRGGGGSDFAIYYINGDNADTWSVKVSPTFTFYYGSGLAYDPSGYVWAVGGYDNVGFGKYSLEDGSWDNTITAPSYIPYLIGRSGNNLVLYGNYLYTTTFLDYQANNEKKNYIWRFNKTTEIWENIQTVTENWNVYGVTAYDGSRYAYMINGESAGQTAITRYDYQNNQYFPETPMLPQDVTYTNDYERVAHAVSTGTALAYDGSDYIYMAQGASSYINRYQISTKRWTQIPNAPCTFYGDIIHTGTSLYLICGNDSKKMYKYDETNKDWDSMKDSEESDGINGAGNKIMAYDGTNTIYVLKGRNTAKIYKYLISTNDWDDPITTIPANVGTASLNNSLGGSLQYYKNGSDEYLYVVRGNATNAFYRYYINTPGWTTLTTIPEPVYTGSSSMIVDGKIYVTSGFFTNTLYIYDIATASWSYGTDAMSPIQAGGSMIKGPGNTAYVLQGGAMYTFWKYNIPSSNSSYKYNGSYTSKPIDLINTYSFVGLNATVASPSATSVSFETRTSTDSASWSAWVNTNNEKAIDSTSYTYTINSPSKRYIQIRTTLNSDESAETPTVSDINIVYYSDVTAPTNPDTLDPYETATQAAALINNTWSNKSAPYFEWSGASDGNGGSGIAGYYVYFGNDEEADASVSGTLQTAANYTASLAIDGSEDGEYFLKIKAVDDAGNISSTNWEPFHYRYDSVAPTALDIPIADPSQYSSTNSYKISWSAVTDPTSNATSSGLFGYKYQATSSAMLLIANDNFITSTSVSGVNAYSEGVNTFYVRAEDIAGNTTAYTGASYKYNATAPSKPASVTDGTSEDNAGANKFSFEWTNPETFKGEAANLKFHYSINVLPTATNISTTSAHFVNDIRGTKQGTNTFYVVAVDEAGNVDYDNYNYKDFEVDITAPGIPLNTEAFDNSIRNTKSYRVGITWDKPTDMGSAFDRYEIYASKTSTACSTSMAAYKLVGTTAGTTTGGSYVVTSYNDAGLESTTYYLCVLACSSSNQCSSGSTTVSMLPTGRWLIAPTMTASPSAAIKTKSATITWSTDRTSNSFVKYGTGSGNYGNEVGSSEQVTAHDIDLTELSPGTTYYYKVLWSDEDGNQGSSSEYSFATNPAPSVSSVKVTSISIYNAYITYTVKNATKARVEYGKTVSYGLFESMSTSKSESTYTIQLNNLTEGTLYHIRIVAEDEEANIYSGDDYTFQTLPVPKVSNVKIQQLVDMANATLRLVWLSNADISSIVTYYPTANPERAIDNIKLTMTKRHEAILRDLVDNTEYSILIKGRDIAGNEAKSEVIKVTTASDIRSPEIQNMSVESTIVGVGDEAKAQIVISWDTDELSTTQVEYAQGTGTAYGQTTQEDTNLTTNHIVTITSLTPSKIYHLRAISKDKASNIGYSFDTVVITPKSTKDALNLVIENLSKTFGFLKGINK